MYQLLLNSLFYTCDNTVRQDAMVIVILQVRQQGLEKWNGFSEILQLVPGRAGSLNPFHCVLVLV